MQRGDMVRVASIDLGTVSSRLLLAEVKDGVIVDSCKRTVITDLGEGVDATGRVFGCRRGTRAQGMLVLC